jgi:hypothetical protein
MNRYISSNIIRDQDKQRYLSTTIIPSITASPEDVYIQITTTERLDLLAQKFYDDVTAWPIIANANGLGKGSLLVKPGTILRIPSKQTFTDLISQLNNRR